MILTCPACGSRYEVAAMAIPPEGRDMECLNCGHAWHHVPATSTAADLATVPTPAPKPDTAPVASTSAATGLSPDVLAFLQDEAARRQMGGSVSPKAEADTALVAKAAASGDRTGTDDAAHDQALEDRKTREQGTGENETGENGTGDSTTEARGTSGETAAPVAPAPILWRHAAESVDTAAGRGGWMILALVAVLAGFVYIAAPTIGRMIPAALPSLNAYTGVIDHGLARMGLRHASETGHGMGMQITPAHTSD